MCSGDLWIAEDGTLSASREERKLYATDEFHLAEQARAFTGGMIIIVRAKP